MWKFFSGLQNKKFYLLGLCAVVLGAKFLQRGLYFRCGAEAENNFFVSFGRLTHGLDYSVITGA